MKPTLLILAAGMGSRYGGLKQLDPLGPSGETLLDYAVFDAVRAGFGKIVFVIRRDFEEAFKSGVSSRYQGQVQIEHVHQSLQDLPLPFCPPTGREKPWGTGHAVWCAREVIDGPFAVIGADDFFGREAFQILAGFLEQVVLEEAGPSPFAMVAYQLEKTLSEHGTVSRGLCVTSPEGFLVSITERTAISRRDIANGTLARDTPVSMNCFGFTPRFFQSLEQQLQTFLETRLGEAKAEFYLPEAVSFMIAQQEARVRVFSTSSLWFGVTHREDKPLVQNSILNLIREGVYPARLF